MSEEMAWAFAVGIGCGLLIAALWIYELYVAYVQPCGRESCQHHNPRPSGRQHK